MTEEVISLHIVVNIKTRGGFENIGQFFVGNKRKRGQDIFRQLIGKETEQEDMLTIELVQTFNELPVKIKRISCTLEELGENCRIITREIFKWQNMEK